MPKVIIPDGREKLQGQMEALEYLIRIDTCERDKQIHKKALEALWDACRRAKAD